jgi:NAD(P)-dependent dehydrogenase (short-subunit alcohol dehydrogenase family)
MVEAQDGAKEGCIVVIGATGGIGSALARRLAAKGNRVLIAGRNPEKLEALAAEIGAVSLFLDARRAAEVYAGLERAVERFGRVDGVANCVGSLLLKPAHLTSQDEFDATVATNLGSAFATVHAAGRVMRQGGSIVLVSSAAALVATAERRGRRPGGRHQLGDGQARDARILAFRAAMSCTSTR